MPRYTLDLVGDVCPVPLLKTEREMQRLKVGDALQIETEHARAVRSICDWARKRRFGVVVCESGNGIWTITITKTG